LAPGRKLVATIAKREPDQDHRGPRDDVVDRAVDVLPHQLAAADEQRHEDEDDRKEQAVQGSATPG
jgi:hypothetical protein